jgi:membrane fusion protein, macrolide-specific efflux system
MTPTSLRRPPQSRCVRLGAGLVLVAAATVVLAACGSAAKPTTSARSSSRGAQVLYTVKSGDLTESASGSVKLTSTTKGKATASVQFIGPEAAQVAAGQTATVTFIKLPAGARFGGARPSGAPSPGSGQGYGGVPSGAPSPGSSSGGFGGSGSGGQGGFLGGGPGQGGVFRGSKQATATVAAVQAGQHGSVTATIAIAKLPSGVTSKYTGFAQVTVKTLAQNVLIVPRAAIKGSGSSATVQLLQNGSTVTKSVTVGQETQTEAEITAGLSAGQNIIYTRIFNGFPGGRSGGGFPGGGQGGFPSGGQGGFPAGGQSNTTTGGA